jgi:predicted TPR repeat methyltransferase
MVAHSPDPAGLAAATTAEHVCRSCGEPLALTMVDLGASPLCERFLRADQLDEMEPFYPLRVEVCQTCFLAQVPAYVAPEDIFTDYAYFSSFSDSWLAHARRYADTMVQRLGLGPSSLVAELGSNDGYLLANFVERGIPVVGIEPAANVARDAEARGVRTIVRFFGRQLAEELVASGMRADLIAANNTLAQIPDLNDAVAGLALLLADDGLITIEVPHLLRLMEGNQFDTIYHEHFSYFSVLSLRALFERHGLRIVDIERLPTHGGSLRVFLQHARGRSEGAAVTAVVDEELQAGLGNPRGYHAFAERVGRVRRDVLTFLIDQRSQGRTVVGYGAPGKANTLLNYCGIRPDLLPFIVDRNPYKHWRFSPGTRIPIYPPDALIEARPDVVWILPWNLRAEIVDQLGDAVAGWGGSFMVAIPSLEIIHPRKPEALRP